MNKRKQIYDSAGFNHSMGFGNKPALLIVDVQKALTDPRSPLGANFDSVVENICSVLDLGREKNIPVFFITIEYDMNLKEAGLWPNKISSLDVFSNKSEMAMIDGRLYPAANEYRIVKKYPSAFFGTNLESLLRIDYIDTVIVTGFTTSGCIRATVVDSLQHGFRPIIPAECVGDRSDEAHEFNLFEMNAKYADVVSLAETTAFLTNYKEEGK